MVDSPISSFYHAVKEVFAPILLKDERWSRQVDPKLQSLLGHLENGLAASLRLTDPSVDEPINRDTLSIIFNPVDEYKYWKELQDTLPTPQQNERAKFFSKILEPFKSVFDGLQRMSFEIDKALKPLTTLNALNYNPYTEALWAASVAQYDQNMQIARKRVAAKIGLENRNFLLGQLVEYMKNSSKDFLACSGGDKTVIPPTHCAPELINDITWIRQLESKIKEVAKVSRSLLDDIDGYHKLAGDIESLLLDFQSYNKEKLDNWTQEMLDSLRTRSLGNLDTGRPVISLNKKGQPEVSYSPRLVTLMREVRQLRVLGYNIPNKNT
ncbi:cytoplasmic dynein 2 heavy chain 1 [Caerostris extrusa]|uniref:Cytoplasmic dynein 2 heavy chain 1 n=1 Tax=Caerostris extrusa TaxID=172846 RepID=A0AAV4SFF0_CAEEX|nr:cytoplasmic dynein 2 heavy chain 1 [Caerostris extrusa]